MSEIIEFDLSVKEICRVWYVTIYLDNKEWCTFSCVYFSTIAIKVKRRLLETDGWKKKTYKARNIKCKDLQKGLKLHQMIKNVFSSRYY